MTGGPHDLLMRHFSAWAGPKRRQPDLELLGEVLMLRDTYDELEPTYWPPRSVEHLLLERWPAMDDRLTPTAGTVFETLDAWFKFLRSTGRMSGRSADIKDLVKELRWSAARMAEVEAAAVDGRSDGSLGSSTAEPDSPGGAAPYSATSSAPLHQVLLTRFGGDDPVHALFRSFGDRLPDGHTSGPEVTGPAFAAAPYLLKLRAFGDWVGAGRRLTDRDLLRTAPAREAYDELGLVEWTRSQAARKVPPAYPVELREGWIEDRVAEDSQWRSAGDCEALERLWWGGLTAETLEIRCRQVIGRQPETLDDEEWTAFGRLAVLGLLDRIAESDLQYAIVVQALMTSYVGLGAPVAKQELQEFAVGWLLGPGHPGFAETTWTAAGAPTLGWIADTGIIEETELDVRLTPTGDAFVAWWLHEVLAPG